MAVWWFRATCFHGLKYLCVNREVLKDNCIIHMVDGKRYTQSCPMGNIEPELTPNMFKRIHRFFIVNIRYIDMYYYGHVVLENGMEVHIAIAKHITSGSASDYFYADDINGVHRKFFRLDENMYDHVKGSTKGKMYFYYALGHLTDNAVVEMKFCGKGDADGDWKLRGCNSNEGVVGCLKDRYLAIKLRNVNNYPDKKMYVTGFGVKEVS